MKPTVTQLPDSRRFTYCSYTSAVTTIEIRVTTGSQNTQTSQTPAFTIYLSSDQKVGGSNPSERAVDYAEDQDLD